MSDDVSKAETRGVDRPRSDPPQGAESVHEQTREKGERAREEREQLEREAARGPDERNQEDDPETPPGD